MTGVILSGGKNRRMGANKAFLTVDGERLIDRTVRLFREVFEEVIIVTTCPRGLSRSGCGHRHRHPPGEGSARRDLHGPLLGAVRARLLHGLRHALPEQGLHRIHGRARPPDRTSSSLLCAEGPQALHAIYSRRCLPVIRGLIDRDKLKITGFYPGHAVRQIPMDTVRSFDPEGRMFINVNTPEDLRNLPAC